MFEWYFLRDAKDKFLDKILSLLKEIGGIRKRVDTKLEWKIRDGCIYAFKRNEGKLKFWVNWLETWYMHRKYSDSNSDFMCNRWFYK